MDKAAKWKAANPVAQIEVLPRGARAAYIHKPLYNRHKACTFASCAMSLQQLLPAVAWQGQAAEDFHASCGGGCWESGWTPPWHFTLKTLPAYTPTQWNLSF